MSPRLKGSIRVGPEKPSPRQIAARDVAGPDGSRFGGRLSPYFIRAPRQIAIDTLAKKEYNQSPYPRVEAGGAFLCASTSPG